MATIVCLNKQAPYGPIEGTQRQPKVGEMKGEDGEETAQNNHLSLSLFMYVYTHTHTHTQRRKERGGGKEEDK